MAGICLLISQFWPRVDIERTKSGLFPAQLLLVDSSVMAFLLFDFPIFSHYSGLNILHPPRASPQFPNGFNPGWPDNGGYQTNMA
jgi:hypothetical protein